VIYDKDGVTVLTKSEIKKDIYSSRDMSKYGEWNWTVHPSSLGRMSYKQLRYIYEVSSSVRPAVDSITREVSTLPWKVIHKDHKYHPSSEVADIVTFLNKPNIDYEDLPCVLSKFINDLLIIGKGCIEKVRNPFGDLMELVARDASLFAPKYNERGFLEGYVEFERDTLIELRLHPKENIIYKYFTPTSYTCGSVPIIETVINEVALIMLSVKAIAWAFTRDEIPPGILHLGEIGMEALERAKASFEASKGIPAQNRLRVVDNVDKVDWVQFTRPFREMQVAELMPMIERIVARNFGLSPVESSLSDVARGVAEMSFASSQSKLIYPMMQIISNIVNNEIVPEFNENALFIWSRVPQEAFRDRVNGWSKLVESGLASDNEARVNLGLDPVQGGDSRSVKLGNERVPLDPTTGLPQYRNPPANTNRDEIDEQEPEPDGEDEDL
jgi:hypothetical protein